MKKFKYLNIIILTIVIIINIFYTAKDVINADFTKLMDNGIFVILLLIPFLQQTVLEKLRL